MAYKSKFAPKNPAKYCGPNIGNIITRSTWEKAVCKAFDKNPNVVRWSSECVVVPYFDTLKMKNRRYFVDFYVEFADGKKIMIEVKPHKETVAPPKFNKKMEELAGVLNESSKAYYHPIVQKKYRAIITFRCNRDKWSSAIKYAEKKDCEFQIWTEHTLKKLGIKIILPLKRKPLGKRKKPVKKKAPRKLKRRYYGTKK